MRKQLLGWMLMALCAQAGAAVCPAKAELAVHKTAQWAKAGPDLLPALAQCLKERDPQLRDELGFEGLQALLRSARMPADAVQELRQRLLAMLQGADADGVARPFAALALAEVARVDRKQAFLSQEQRRQLAQAAADWIKSIQDYRAWDAQDGWRHAVAHGADWVMQLALNPALEEAQAAALLQALSVQMGQNRHAYTHGEGERIAQALFYLALREPWDEARWRAWAAQALASLPPAGSVSAAQLTQKHNLGAVWLPLYFMLQQSRQSALRQRLSPIVEEALKKLQ
ncbi:DUF2785 domain-containing protein [Massilia sp. W12]|uniref:DUF2785 domain-containing protein n=1 Tax=Massilia sp. W12 TaxID=3126507 RepID=UPI0030D5B4F5